MNIDIILESIACQEEIEILCVRDTLLPYLSNTFSQTVFTGKPHRNIGLEEK